MQGLDDGNDEAAVAFEGGSAVIAYFADDVDGFAGTGIILRNGQISIQLYRCIWMSSQ